MIQFDIGGMIVSHDLRTPAAVHRAYPDLADAPTIAEVFHPELGWRTLRGLPAEVDRLVVGRSPRKRISTSYARKLRADGITMVSLDLGGGRRADFTTPELCRRSAA